LNKKWIYLKEFKLILKVLKILEMRTILLAMFLFAIMAHTEANQLVQVDNFIQSQIKIKPRK
jgi:hypothetical protein